MTDGSQLTVERHIILTEYPDLISLRKLLHPSIRVDGEPLYESELKKIREYLRHSEDNCFKCSYNTSDYIYGRLWAKNGIGLQGFWRKIRHTIAHKNYYDIDIVNSAPTILTQLLKKNNIDCIKLEKYKNNRKTLLQEININYDDAKSLINSIINGGSIKNLCEKKSIDINLIPKWVYELKSEMVKINNHVYNKLQPLEITDELLDYWEKNEKNPINSYFSLVYQEEEKKVLLKIYDFFTRRDFNVDVLIHDGCMIRKNKEINDELLKECHNYILETTGYDIEIIIKSMNEIINLDGIPLPKKELNLDDLINLTEASHAKNLSEFCLNKYIFYWQNHQPTLYKYTGVYWKKMENNGEILNIITNELTNYYYEQLENITKKKDFDDKVKPFISKIKSNILRLGGTNNQKHIVEQFSKLSEMCFDGEFNSNPNLFAFEDCIYDFETGKFIEPKPEQYINLTCGYEWNNFDENSGKNYIERINKFLEEITPDFDTKKSLISILCTTIYKYNREQRVIFFTGLGGNGKGLLVNNLLSNMLGQYSGIINMSYWENYDDGKEINNMLVKNRYSHIHISSESSERFVIRNIGKFKNFSGGDIIEVRPAFGHIIQFKSGLPIFLTNNLPEFKTTTNLQSLERRIIVFRLPFYFASEDKIDYKNPSHKLRDTSLEEKFTNDINYPKALFWILINYGLSDYKKNGLFISENVKQETENYFCSINKLRYFLKNILEFSQNSTIKINEIHKEYLKIEPNFSILNFSKEITNLNQFSFLKSMGYRMIKDYKFKDNFQEIMNNKFINTNLLIETLDEES